MARALLLGGFRTARRLEIGSRRLCQRRIGEAIASGSAEKSIESRIRYEEEYRTERERPGGDRIRRLQQLALDA